MTALYRPTFTKSVLAAAIAIACLAPATLMAQGVDVPLNVAVTAIDGQGIRGQLSDDRNVLLQGAQVRIIGGNRETSTDGQGRFRFDNLVPGSYQLEIRYLGYAPKSVDVVVTAERGAELTLRFASNEVEVMHIVGSRDAQSRALNIQRASDNLKSVVSSDYLGRFPDDNVAEAMQRLVGASIQRDQGEGKYVNVRGAPLEFTNVTIDGVNVPSPDGGTRAVDLDTIPSDIISILELTKAITPEMDADAIAGNINIITQGALDAKGRILRGKISGGKNEKGSGDAYKASLTFGNKFGENENAGFIFSAKHSETNRVTDNVEHGWMELDNGNFVPEFTEFKDYETKRIRTGLSGRFDFRIDDNKHFFFSHNYSRFEDNEFRDTLVVEWERHTEQSNQTSGVAGRATFEKELRHRTFINTINTTVLGGRIIMDTYTADFQASYASAEQAYPNRDYLLYREATRPRVAYDFSNPDLPSYQILNSAGEVVRTDFNFAPSAMNWRRYERRTGGAEETEQAYSFNITRPGQWGEAYSELKFGAKARLKDKSNDENRFRNSVGANAPSYADVIIDKQSLPFDGYYNNGPKLQRDFVSAYRNIFENADFLDRGAPSITGDYKAGEDILAAYVQNKLEWENTTVLFGARVEQTKNSGEAFEYDLDTDTATLVDASKSYTNFFPSVHLRQELDNGVIVKAAYSTGLRRPNFADLVPYFIIEDRESGRGTVDIGNIDLKPTYSHNLDLTGEFYIAPVGLISAGVFYKKLSDPIFKARSEFVGGEFDGFRMVRPENGNSGYLYGLELNWQQSLNFLPGALSGLGFIANYTHTKSEADLPFGIGKTELNGTSRHTLNLALQYDIAKFSTQLAYNYRSEYIDAFDTANPGLNVYWDGRGTLDYTASYKLTKDLSVFLEATNLTDSKAIRYQGERNRVYEHEQFGRAWQVGVSGKF
ncbi:TonB-dependent receptor [Alishewanella longhuensis]|uniref:TonB-dependent receptor n=1 Tax=Alishewanella longhuensis TaxID=1091037 RepID=A0ABQ3KVN3_9ALTE|nr:TonB-dependent receptor [Alishewanella longhuensis]GHG60467.1 TonB-dependent receptor [Alishewanella longhuensis]